MPLKTFYNLPKKVKFCKICVNSNQYPASIPEFNHQRDRKKHIIFRLMRTEFVMDVNKIK